MILQISTTVALVMVVVSTSVLALDAPTDVNATVGTGCRGMDSAVKVHRM